MCVTLLSKEQTYSDNSAERRPLEGTTTEQVEKEQAEGTEQSEQPKKQQQKSHFCHLQKKRFLLPPLPKISKFVEEKNNSWIKGRTEQQFNVWQGIKNSRQGKEWTKGCNRRTEVD